AGNNATTGLWQGKVQGQNPRQRNFIIFVTDGDDQCGPPNSGTLTQAQLDQNARAPGFEAERLYQAKDPGNVDPLQVEGSRVTTFFVAFGASTGIQRSNWIAWAVSGLGNYDTIPNDGVKWTRDPDPTKVALCKAAGFCRDAFAATNAAELEAAIQSAIDQGGVS